MDGLTTSTINKGTHDFSFNQRGEMSGLGLQGSQVIRIKPYHPSYFPHAQSLAASSGICGRFDFALFNGSAARHDMASEGIGR
jgi:hypothetical protein